MFSIVIPLYNKEISVTNTIHSVLSQTYTEFEIIVVNDGSTDNSLSVVKKIQDPRIRIIDKPNGGVSSARNRGIQEAKYDWICFLDADDLWTVDHLSEFYTAVINNSDCNWFISGFTFESNRNKINKTYYKSGILDNIFNDLQKGLLIHTSSVCIKKELFFEYESLFFTEGINNSEDREVWYKLCCINKNPYYIQKSLSIYDGNVQNSLTKDKNGVNKDHFLTLYSRLQNFKSFKNLNVQDIEKFNEFIYKFNNNTIKSRYKNGVYKKEYNNYLNLVEKVIISQTVNFPRIIKKVISKLL